VHTLRDFLYIFGHTYILLSFCLLMGPIFLNKGKYFAFVIDNKVGGPFTKL